MSAPHFLVPGPLDTPTGGFRYDKRIIEGLKEQGLAPVIHILPEGFPHLSDDLTTAAEAALTSIPSGAKVVIDGLALGVLPELAREHSQRLRLVALVHHPLCDETGLHNGERNRLFKSEKAALACAERIIVTSETTARRLANFDIASTAIGVVRPGTDPAAIAVGSPGPGLALLCVGALIPRKGHLLLLDALAELTRFDWQLTCIGSTERHRPYAERVQQRLASSPLVRRIKLAGEYPFEALGEAYARSDLLVLASYHEGYGMVFAEALARGLPIVATAGGATETTVPADAGLLSPPGDLAALRANLARFMREPELRRQLAEGARRARQLLPSWTDAAMRFVEELRKVSPA